MADETKPTGKAATETASTTQDAGGAAQPTETRGEGRGPGDRGNRGGPGGNRGNRSGGGDNRGPRRDGGRREDGRGNRSGEEGPDLVEKLVNINRVSKTVKGGKRFGFAALVVVGDGKGKVGHGAGKAREVPEAISKATAAARRNMIKVALREGRTIHHDVRGIFGAGEVVLRTAPSGTGIIAGGPMRAVFEAVGMHDVVAKSVGTSNPHNMVKATFAALQSASSPRSVAARRGKKVTDIMGSKGREYGAGEPGGEAATESEEA